MANVSKQPPKTISTIDAKWILIGLIVFWALELTLVQHWSTFAESAIPFARMLKDSARRLVLNVAFCTFVVLLLRRWALLALFVVGFLASNGLILYSQYFGRPLSWPVLSSQWREGFAVSDHGLSLVSVTVLAPTLIALIAKAALQFSAVRHRCWDVCLSPRQRSIRIVTAVIFIYMLAGVYKPIHRINMGNPPYIYGYFVAWTTEALAYDHEALRELAMQKAALQSDWISDVEPVLTLGKHIAVIQVESLDFDVVDANTGGEKIMPFLIELSEQSKSYLVKPFHNTGSSEADFSTLTTATTNGKVNPFQIYGFPYTDTLPRAAKSLGYHVVAMHGNTGEFFHRRDAYKQMGFDELIFTEELVREGINGKMDHEVLNHSANLLQDAGSAKSGELTQLDMLTYLKNAFTNHTGIAIQPSDSQPEPAKRVG